MTLTGPWRSQMRWMLTLGLMTAWSASAWGQIYNCTSSGGIRYQSRSPCPVGSKPPGITYHGPTSAPPTRSPVPVPRAGDELAYMSSKCSSMQEAIRTAPARGIDSLTIRELRRNFDIECQEERSRALQQLSASKREKRKQVDEQMREENLQKVHTRETEQKLMDQCAEMRRSLHQRKQRPINNEGESRDLMLFEERYTLRCVQAASR